jgi:hypothetical protein
LATSSSLTFAHIDVTDAEADDDVPLPGDPAPHPASNINTTTTAALFTAASSGIFDVPHNTGPPPAPDLRELAGTSPDGSAPEREGDALRGYPTVERC